MHVRALCYIAGRLHHFIRLLYSPYQHVTATL